MPQTTPHSLFLDAVRRGQAQDTERAERAAEALARTLRDKTLPPCGHACCRIEPQCKRGVIGRCSHKECQIPPHCRYGSGMASLGATRSRHRAGAVVSPPSSTPQGAAGDPLRKLRQRHRQLLMDINDLEREFERDPSVFSDEHHDELDAQRADAGRMERQIAKMTRAMIELRPMMEELTELRRTTEATQ